MQEIAPNLFMENRFPPYNLGLVVTGHGVIAIDAPPRPSHARAWLDEVRSAWSEPRFLVLTDARPERLVGAALWRVPLIVAEATARCLAAFDDKTWPDLLAGVGRAFPDELELLASLLPPHPTFVLTAPMQLHYTSPPLRFECLSGSAAGALMLTAAAQKVLFAGDTVVADQPPELPRTPDFDAWLKTLSLLGRRKEVQWIVPGQGPRALLRGELETQQEFMRTLEHVAARLSRKGDGNEGVAQAATELQQAFYPHAAHGSAIYRTLREGVEWLTAQKRAQRLEATAQRAAVHPEAAEALPDAEGTPER